MAKRRGIYEIAIRAGVPLFCSYTFGTTDAFDAYWGSKGSFLPTLSRKLRTSLFVFWGRFGLPIPKRVAITTVWAEQIPVVQCDVPTDEQISELQQKTLQAYRVMFELHKVSYGWKHKALIIK